MPRKHRWWIKGLHTKDDKPVAAAAGDRAPLILKGLRSPTHSKEPLFSLIASLLHLCTKLPAPLCPAFPRTELPSIPLVGYAAAAGTPTSACFSSAAMKRTLSRGSRRKAGDWVGRTRDSFMWFRQINCACTTGMRTLNSLLPGWKENWRKKKKPSSLCTL